VLRGEQNICCALSLASPSSVAAGLQFSEQGHGDVATAVSDAQLLDRLAMLATTFLAWAPQCSLQRSGGKDAVASLAGAAGGMGA